MSITQSVPVGTTSPLAGGRAPHLFGAACGIVLTLLALSTSFPADPSDLSDSSVRAWVSANEGTLRWYAGSLSLSAPLVVVFAAYLRGRALAVRPDLRFVVDAFVGCAGLCAVWFLIAGAAAGLLVFDPDSLSDGVAHSSYAIEALGDAVATSALAARAGFLLTAGAAVLATRMLPRWLGWLALVLGALTLAGGAGIFVEGTAVQALFYVGIFAFALWPLPAGIAVVVRTLRTGS